MKTLVFLFFAIPVISFGQELRWNFENNDLTQWYQNLPDRWEISSENVIGGSYSLHTAYDNAKAGTDWISLFHNPLKLDEAKTVWQFSVRYKYRPSANNHWEVMLASDNLPGDDKLMESALVLGVNYRGSDDEIRMWKQKGELCESILSTGFNWEQNIKAGSIVSLKITRIPGGHISLEMDTFGGCYFQIGETVEPEITQSQSFLVCYTYSASYDRGLYFDDLLINGKFQEDTPALKIHAIHVLSPNRIMIEFNQIVKVEKENNFYIEGVGCGAAINMAGRYIEIGLPFAMLQGEEYRLKISGISDMFNKSLLVSEQNQLFYYPAVNDVVINELLADPLPQVLLPDAEFIELFNTTDKKISLFNWGLRVNNKMAILPNISIFDGEFLVLCNADSAAIFEVLDVKTIGIHDFPAISNQSVRISITDQSGRLMHAVDYSNKWYESELKQDGGWSMEMVNPKDPCIGKGNWKESEDYRGGTPGQVNSVFSESAANKAPKLWRAAVTDSGSILLFFSEPMDSSSLMLKESYSVDQNIGSPVLIKPSWPIANRVELFFTKKFEPAIIYRISLSGDPCDCSGLLIGNHETAIFSIPENADSSDLVINEIMFNPRPTCEEYLELYNRSLKTIDLKKCRLITGDPISSPKAISADYFQMAPDSYVVLAKNYTGIDSDHEFGHPEKLVIWPGMPALTDAGAHLYLLDKSGRGLDAAFYSPDFQQSILQETKGVALERISPEVSGMLGGNWHSAASDAGYQTPAAPNSQSASKESKNCIILSPKTITPNSDGIDDGLSICYRMDEPDYMARIFIFDRMGNLLAVLANGSILGSSGGYSFKGYSDAGVLLKTGLYIMYFEAYDDSGSRFVQKKTFVVAE
jgi:hypothetical protein